MHRVRRGEVSQLQDAFVHRRHRQPGRLAGVESGNRNRQFHGLARLPFGRCVEGDGQGARCGVQSHPGHADGPARSTLLGAVRRAERGGGDVHTRTPFGGNRQFHRRAIGAGADRLAQPQPVADHVQKHLAGEGRAHEDLGGFAGLVARFIQRHLHLVGSVALAGGFEPAGGEAYAGGDAGGRIEHVQPVMAPVQPSLGHHGRLAGGEVQSLTASRCAVADDQLVVPATFVVIPIILIVLTHQFGAQPVLGQRLAQRIECDHLEYRVLAGLDAAVAEARLDADGERLGPIG